jgi:peptide/nickel transport system permease protein
MRLLKSFGYNLGILWGVVTLTFALFILFPGADEMMVGQRTDLATKESIRKELGLDLPAWKRYLFYLNDLSPVSVHNTTREVPDVYSQLCIGDNKIVVKKPNFRFSYQTRRPVTTILGDALKGTLVLALVSMFFAFIIGVAFGSIAALNQHNSLDPVILGGSTLFISMPSFFSAILIAWLFGYLLNHVTGLNMTGSLYEMNPETGEQYVSFKNLILPAFALSMRPVAVLTQLTRASVMTVLKTDYIRTAKAKGLSPFRIIFKHTLRNALNPVITAASGWLASMLAGAFFIEYIFNWNGLGKVLIDAVQMADLPVVMGGIIYIAVIFVIINILVDFSYRLLDPRVSVTK